MNSAQSMFADWNQSESIHESIQLPESIHLVYIRHRYLYLIVTCCARYYSLPEYSLQYPNTKVYNKFPILTCLFFIYMPVLLL